MRCHFSTLRDAGLVCALACALAATAADTRALPLTPGVPQSCGMQLKSNNFDVKTLDAVRTVGFRVIRRGFYWDAVEKQKGVYDFSAYDTQMAHARAQGLTVIGTLFNSSKLYEDDGRGGIQTAPGREGFANFAAALAKHYADNKVLWEIWNEPNVRTFWRKDGTHNSPEFAREYTDLVKAAAPAMLKADPNAFIMAGSVSNYWQPSYDWSESCMKEGILTTGIRGWSVHPYGVRTPEEFTIGHTRTRELLKQYGAPDMPILNTERGFAAQKPQDAREEEGWSGGALERQRDYQADHFVRQFMIDQLNGVLLTVWYEWGGNEFAFVGGDGPRPAHAAAGVMMARLNGYRLSRRLDSDYPRDYLLLWTDAAGNRQLVAWTSPPPGGTPDEALPHKVAIKTTGPGRCEVADIRGKVSTLETLELTLTGSPQYISLPRGLELGAITTTPPAAPVAAPQGPAPVGQDLQLFQNGEKWKFVKNTGDGAFTTDKDDKGTPIGVVQYDFSNAKTGSTPYVLAVATIQVDAASQLSLDARSAIAQPLTFRVVDNTGQTLQFKQRIKGTGQWENIRIPLNKKLEHWDGANDGIVHFPIKSLVLSVPRPGEEQKTGKVEYANIIAVAGGDAPPAKPTPKTPPPATTQAPATPPKGIAPTANGELKVLESKDGWRFVKNTGEGSFSVAKDDQGTPIGVVQYDFTNSKTGATPYVLAFCDLKVDAAETLSLDARSDVAQPLTFRLVDDTGQTLQFKQRIKGTGQWETISIALTKKLEHWGGANDGMVHFPLKQMAFSVPRPNEEHLTGKVEFARIRVSGGADAGATKPTTQDPAATVPKEAPAAPKETATAANGELKVLDTQEGWRFVKNTGEGSFSVAKDDQGTPIGVVQYDFSKSKTGSTPYVLAFCDIIVETAESLSLDARSDVAQPLTFRLVDDTGQTLQFKQRIMGTGAWEKITIPLNKKLEHWGGANDGVVHFPLKQMAFSVPRPSEEHLTGKVEFAHIQPIGGAETKAP
jgi:hypothetical protein